MHERHLTPLDLVDDGQQEFIARAEVMQQHAMAGADGRGHIPQRPVADASYRELLHHRVEQLLAPLEVRRPGHRGDADARFGP